MVKKAGVKLMGIFVVLFIGLSLFSYYSRKNSASTMSGMSITNLPIGINLGLIAFIAQWIVLLMVVIFAYTKFLKHRKEEAEKIAHFVIPKLKSQGETEIDLFYRLLKEKKSLTSGTVAKAFNITKEQALNWAKILEEHNLVLIEYPAFADPEFKVAEEEKSQDDSKKNKLSETNKEEDKEETED
jgi:hypothetical protein